MKALRPFYFVLAFVLFVGLACNFGSTPTPAPTEQPTQQQQQSQPTQTPQQSMSPTDTPEQAVTATTTAQPYYTEDFSGSLDNWSYFVEHGDENKLTINTGSNGLAFDLEGNDMYVYVTYDPYTYTNVRLDMTADNRGKNNNNVSLVCRYSNEGWYEFNIANNGLYNIYAYDAKGIIHQGYNKIYNGASLAIKEGRDTNQYSVSCVDYQLSLAINGVAVKTVKDTKFKFQEGKVGFSVSSFNVTPILVDITSFQISKP